MCSSRNEIILEGNPLIVDQCKPQEPPTDAAETSHAEITSARGNMCMCIHVFGAHTQPKRICTYQVSLYYGADFKFNTQIL